MCKQLGLLLEWSFFVTSLIHWWGGWIIFHRMKMTYQLPFCSKWYQFSFFDLNMVLLYSRLIPRPWENSLLNCEPDLMILFIQSLFFIKNNLLLGIQLLILLFLHLLLLGLSVLVADPTWNMANFVVIQIKCSTDLKEKELLPWRISP